MLEIGRAKLNRAGLNGTAELRTGDAMAIPFEDQSFDAVSISFGIRNMTDVPKALSEMYRILKPNGRALILEFSIPTSAAVRGPYLFYLRHILPRLGTAISGDSGAYRYLNETIESFPCGEAFLNLMSAAGFRHSEFTPLQFGIATLYQGDRL
jgi:demethylmenaquinone methyltransferase/2-methoxy-6-polyprenyl-1,4-benzoquinol methylase